MNVAEAYKALRLGADADMDAVKKAFRKLAFELHPDLNADNPHAARMFQRVNEAYVLLKNTLEGEGAADADARKAQAKAGKFAQEQAKRDEQDRAAQEKTRQEQARARQARARAQQAKAKTEKRVFRQEDVVQDILKDPFAKQVFEDIYNQIRRDGGKPAKIPKKKKMFFEWGDKSFSLDLTQGLWGGAKGWLRGQLDDKQDVVMPGAALMPGAKVRLAVFQGGKKVSVEVTLPPDWKPGKPIRLKGLGRKIGKWTGDLYVSLRS